ncbi:putative nucleoporin Nup58 [Lucilia cuprina]|uniref:Putative nucleoporin Nup58 n=1 Tax=Lucilia cuprina TaxID=7375 RepID=A0A0L0BSW8_LUCCU|nr:putative nucleoporin Nup58 [Lucilia cuprina]KNC23137.1 putative nucleoporin Nup58 [Lucilia cuprina]
MSGFSFGAAATSTPVQPQATSGFSFGAPKTTAATTGFGASTTGFGATAQTTGFGATAAAPAFGATATSAAPAFGATATSAAPAFGGGTSFSFGTPASTAPAAAGSTSFGFGAQQPAASSAAAPTLNFAAPTATSTASTGALPSLGLGGGLGGNFSFMKPAATTSASINFGTTTTTTLGGQPTAGGLFAKPLTTTTAAPATAPAPFVGLGGLDVSASKPKAGDSKQDIKVKETQVPEEIAKTVDALKTHIKTQKTLSSDIGRTSTSKLTNVSGEIMNLQWALQEISNSVEANYNHIKLLRKETSKTIQSVEMAQRTQDTPVGLQFENNAPFQFFQYLVAKYEQDLINFRQQIALTERHMHSLTNPQNVSPDDLKRGFRQINESFISLAGRLHEIHQKVEAQKDQYLNLRKYRLRDNTNVFAQLDNPESKVDTTRITAGPTPFSNITAISNFGKSFTNSSASKGQTTQTGK